MLKRTLTGLVILLATAGFILLRWVSPFFFDAFALVIIYGALVEIVRAYRSCGKKLSLVLPFAYPVGLELIYVFSGSIKLALLLQLCELLLLFTLLMAIELIQNASKRRNGAQLEGEELNKSLLNETKDTLQVAIYPTTLLGFLIGMNHLGLALGWVAIIMTFAVAMTTDVFAFIFGITFKGPKMAPEISPKKSISGMVCGAIGGMAAAAVCYVLFAHLGLLNAFEGVSLASKIVLFALAGVFGTFMTQFGDLVASAFKRKVGIKDFGSILPGHGGVMDRVDGLMFTGALVYVLFCIFAL